MTSPFLETMAQLLADLSALRLEATPDDIAGLRADGYLGEVVAELQAAQQGSQQGGDGAQAGQCRHPMFRGRGGVPAIGRPRAALDHRG